MRSGLLCFHKRLSFCPRGEGRGRAWQGSMRGGGVHDKRACVAGGVHGGGGTCVAGETATEADGTHPTGMHSCYQCKR